MKSLIVVEMALLYFGNVARYAEKEKLSLTLALEEVGARSAVPVALLAFWLMVMADLGAVDVAAMLGGMIVFSYLTMTTDTLEDITELILAESKPPKETEEKKE